MIEVRIFSEPASDRCVYVIVEQVIELHYDGKVTCEFGEVATVFGSSRTPGVVHDVAPLILGGWKSRVG